MLGSPWWLQGGCDLDKMGKFSHRSPDQNFWKKRPHLRQRDIQPQVTHHTQALGAPGLLLETAPYPCRPPGLAHSCWDLLCAGMRGSQEARAGGCVCDGAGTQALSASRVDKAGVGRTGQP